MIRMSQKGTILLTLLTVSPVVDLPLFCPVRIRRFQPAKSFRSWVERNLIHNIWQYLEFHRKVSKLAA